MSETDAKEVEKFFQRMFRIAVKNEDEFDIELKIILSRIGSFQGYCLTVNESAEGHTFLVARKYDLMDTLESANDQIEGACRLWNYKLVE